MVSDSDSSEGESRHYPNTSKVRNIAKIVNYRVPELALTTYDNIIATYDKSYYEFINLDCINSTHIAPYSS